jgi:hypothetical protein
VIEGDARRRQFLGIIFIVQDARPARRPDESRTD